jgi:hypothetical protein
MGKRVKAASRITAAIQMQSRVAARRGQRQFLANGRGFEILVKGYRAVWPAGADMPVVVERPVKPA